MGNTLLNYPTPGLVSFLAPTTTLNSNGTRSSNNNCNLIGKNTVTSKIPDGEFLNLVSSRNETTHLATFYSLSPPSNRESHKTILKINPLLYSFHPILRVFLRAHQRRRTRPVM